MTSRAHLILGLVALALAVLAAFLWIPLDTDSGLLETVRRRVSIGDALAPTIAAAFIGLGGFSLILFEGSEGDSVVPSRENMFRIFALTGIVVLAILIMRWAGPVTLGAEEYRLLRATPPWSWLGFLIGGALLVTALVAGIERRLSFRAVFVGVGWSIALILLFDLPFEDLLLPPNGDV
ncbi:MAG: hypothetical protein AAF714_01575 [Pseudomonadota bacterium]